MAAIVNRDLMDLKYVFVSLVIKALLVKQTLTNVPQTHVKTVRHVLTTSILTRAIACRVTAVSYVRRISTNVHQHHVKTVARALILPMGLSVNVQMISLETCVNIKTLLQHSVDTPPCHSAGFLTT